MYFVSRVMVNTELQFLFFKKQAHSLPGSKVHILSTDPLRKDMLDTMCLYITIICIGITLHDIIFKDL